MKANRDKSSHNLTTKRSFSTASVQDSNHNGVVRIFPESYMLHL